MGFFPISGRHALLRLYIKVAINPPFSITDRLVNRILWRKSLTKSLPRNCPTYLKILFPVSSMFTVGRFTTTNLLVFQNYLSTVIEEGSQVDVINTDFEKAFNSANHDILLDKLSALGIYGSLLKWLSNFLRNRSQVVKFNNSFSKNF